MRIGVVARPETQRGLGIQTRTFIEHMPVHRILQLDFPTKTGFRTNYTGDVIRAAYNNITHSIDHGAITSFLHDLDVVFCAETPGDWSLLDVAREMGVKTVIQGNPEFVRHGQEGYDYAHPDEWWWPTRWRLDRLPPGRVMPVPMPTVQAAPAPLGIPRLKVLHVAGHRAHADRNGTQAFLQALRSTREQMDVTITSVDEEPIVMLPQRNLRLFVHPNGFQDRWEAYRGQHALVLPRRYGGLCLPALEAMASGVAVAMTEMSPNTDWPIERLIPQRFEDLWMAGGHIDAAVFDPQHLAFEMDALAVRMQRGELDLESGRQQTFWWEEGGRDLYLDALEGLCAS